MLIVFLALLTEGAFLALSRDQVLFDTYYYAGLIDKHALIATARSPKIVFIGGSNLAFGLDSAEVEQRLCRPVVNMGLHAGLGLRLPLNEVRDYIQPGDVVVISPEYQLFWGLFDGDDILAWALYLEPDMVRYFDTPWQFWAVVRTLPTFVQLRMLTYLQSNLQSDSAIPGYDRRSFNRYGDVVGHLTRPSIDISKVPLFTIANRDVEMDAIEYLNDFASSVRASGGDVFIEFPPVPDKQYLENESDIQQLYTYLAAHLKSRIIARPAETVLPLSDFYDTVYHLNAAGRNKRTQLVIEKLRAVLEGPAGGLGQTCQS
jgi:hypothetical protein